MDAVTAFFSEMFDEDAGAVYACPNPDLVGHSTVYVDGFGLFEVFCLDALTYPDLPNNFISKCMDFAEQVRQSQPSELLHECLVEFELAVNEITSDDC